MHTQEEIKNILERHFKEISDVYGIEMAFLYGSWERGFMKKFSDAVLKLIQLILELEKKKKDVK